MADNLAGSEARGAPEDARVAFGNWVNWLGAGVSLALLAGIGVWGYQLAMRDVTGIPVVRAAEGPMRVQPETPGGEVAEHQGLSVNTVAAVGTASGPVERVMLAPRPVDLADEDQPAVLLAAAEPDAEPSAVTAPAALTGPAPTPQPVSLTDLADRIVSEDLADAAAPDDANPIEDPLPADQAAATEAEPTEALASALEDAISASVTAAVAEAVRADLPEGALVRSLRPQMRPGALRTASIGPAMGPAADTADELDPAGLPVGTRLVQLGAFDTAEAARAEWDRIVGRFPDYMADKARVIEEASAGGRAFFRLRAHGFGDLSDARRFCAVLVAGQTDCIPVVTR